jgi:DNA mismatch repair protein MutS2
LKEEFRSVVQVTNRVFEALGMQQVFDLIEVSGDFLPEVKKRELKRRNLKQTELKDRYARLGKLMEALRGEETALRTLRELFAHLTRPLLPIGQNSYTFALHELFLIKEFLYNYANLHSFVRKQGWIDLFPLPDLHSVFDVLDTDKSGLPAFKISGANSPKLGEILSSKLESLNKLKHFRALLLQEARTEMDMPALKDEFVISRTNVELAEKLLHSSFFVLSYENVANYSFLLADDETCLELKKKLSLLQEKQEKEEAHVLKELSRKICEAMPLLRSAIHILEESGWRFVLADFALKYNCCLPKLVRKPHLRITGAVNLPLKLHLEALGRRFQLVDYDFPQKVSLLTGPNMGGKTTILKTVGQLCWLARLGIPLPCKDAEIPLFDNIWYNQDDARSGADLSSFGEEVVSFTAALKEEGLTLFLLDEFARGTNPSEGEKLVCAVLRHLSESDNVCIASTHFTAPAMLENIVQYSIAGLDTAGGKADKKAALSPAQRLDALSKAMDYSLKRLEKHQAPPLNAIHIARLLGLPENILNYIQDKE